MAKPQDIHIVPNQGKWAVKSTGTSRAAPVHDTQRAAIDAVRDVARNRQAELFIPMDVGDTFPPVNSTDKGAWWKFLY